MLMKDLCIIVSPSQAKQCIRK